MDNVLPTEEPLMLPDDATRRAQAKSVQLSWTQLSLATTSSEVDL